MLEVPQLKDEVGEILCVTTAKIGRYVTKLSTFSQISSLGPLDRHKNLGSVQFAF